MGHLPPMQASYHPPDPSMYAHDHRGGVNGYGESGAGPGGGYHEPLPGPSRLPDQYGASYPSHSQGARGSPLPPPGSGHGRQLPLPQPTTNLSGWQPSLGPLHTPMHGGAGAGPPRPASANRTPAQAVKLEDLVDHPHSQHGQVRPGPGGFTSVPLDTTSGMRPPSMMGQDRSGVGSGQGVNGAVGGGASQQQPGPSEFIKKLYKMLEEESAMYGNPEAPRPKGAKRGSVGWGRGGQSFVVWDMNEFTTKVL